MFLLEWIESEALIGICRRSCLRPFDIAHSPVWLGLLYKGREVVVPMSSEAQGVGQLDDVILEFDELLALTTALVSSPLSVHDIITLLLESDETSTEPASPEVFI